MQRLRIFTTAIFLALISVSSGIAQDEVLDLTGRDEATNQPTDRLGIWRRGPDGTKRFIPLKDLGLDDVTFEQYLKQLQRIPRYQITGLDLTGIADDKNVKLTAVIQIHIDQEFGDEWIRVPIGIPEATLTAAAKYTGPGTATFDRQAAKASGDRAWFIRGAGNHKLTLPLIRPLREQEHTKRRLALTLPAAGSSHIRLQIPGSDFRIDTTALSGATLSEKDEKSFIDAYGLGADFKLNWERQPKVSLSQLQLANRTEILADLSQTPIKVTAKQTVSAPRGSFEQLVVTLPRGMRVFDITELRDIAADPFLKDYTVDETSAETTKVTVYLNRPCSDSLRLNWDLEPVNQDIPGKLTFESFRVEGANAHTGEVEVIAPAGFEIERIDTPVDARRTTVKTSFSKDQIATAYEFTSDRFRLMLDIREIEPTYSISPTIRVTAADDTLTLRAEFVVQVGRGALKQLELNWPGYQSEGWQQEFAFDAEEYEDWDLTEIRGDGRFTIDLLNRQSRKFKFVLQATRPIPQNTGAGKSVFELTLPEIPDSDGSKRWVSTDLVTTEASDLSLVLTPVEGTAITPFVLRDEVRPTFDTDARTEAFRITSRLHRFEAELSEQTGEIEATSSAVVSFSGNTATVQQTLDFDVRFLRVDKFLLNVPESLTSNIAVSFEGTVLPELASSETTRRSVQLSKSVLGRTQLVARYTVDLSDDPTSLQIPWVSCLDADFSTVRVEVADTGAMNCEPADPTRWKQVYAPSGNRTWESRDWQSSDIDQAIDLRLQKDSSRPQHRYSVRQAFIQTAIDGSFKSRAQFRVDGNPLELEILIPDGCRYERIRWNGAPVDAVSVKTVGSDQQLTLPIPDSQPVANWLTLDFYSDSRTTDPWHARHELVSPRFTDGVWVDETTWQVIVVGQQLLLDFGRDYSARYHWERGDVVWHRKSDQLSAFDNLVVTPGAARSYTVGRLGSNVPLVIHTTHRSVNFLVGAGIALLLGFVLFRLTTASGLAFIGFIAVALALASVIWPVPIEVLVQPAIVGMALGLAAAGIERFVQQVPRRGRRGARMPQVDELTFVPGKKSGLGAPIETGSEDRTVVRTAPIPLSAGSAGSGVAGS